MNKKHTSISESATPVFDEFVGDIFPGYPEGVKELQRYLGLMLWPAIMRARGSA
jgi:hypothetical protein